MEIAFLGTCSSSPSLTRSQQSTALRLGGDIWLFDCGEAAQLQLARRKWKASRVSSVLISHMHGDHVFGLPGMLCAVAAAHGDAPHAVTVVGPRGLRLWLRVSLLHTYALLGCMRYSVHELCGLAAEGPQGSGVPRLGAEAFPELHPSEDPGLDLWPDAEGLWRLPRADGAPVSVTAAEISHSVPTVGFCVEEDARPGTVDAGALLPVLEREGLPRSAVGDLKAGRPVPLPRGGELRPGDYVGPETRRKLVLLGDLSEPLGPMLSLAEGCDLLVHEATNAFVPREDRLGPEDVARGEEETERAARAKGHSTPQVAGRFAKRAGARHLALNHFSAMFPGGEDEESVATMERVADLARRECGVPVFPTRDLMVLRVGLNGKVAVDDTAPTA